MVFFALGIRYPERRSNEYRRGGVRGRARRGVALEAGGVLLSARLSGDPIDALASPDRTPAHLQLIRVEHALAELGDRAALAVPLDVRQVVGEEVDVVLAARRRANASDNIWMHEPEEISLRRPALVLLDDLDHLLVVCETEIRRARAQTGVFRQLNMWNEISEISER